MRDQPAAAPTPAGPDDPPVPAPRWARWFVAAYLAVFVVCGVAGLEAWLRHRMGNRAMIRRSLLVWLAQREG